MILFLVLINFFDTIYNFYFLNHDPLEQFDLINFFLSFNNAVIFLILVSVLCIIVLFFNSAKKFKWSSYYLNFYKVWFFFVSRFRLFMLKKIFWFLERALVNKFFIIFKVNRWLILKAVLPSGPASGISGTPSGAGLPQNPQDPDYRKKLLNKISEHLACKEFIEFLNSDELRKLLNSESFKIFLNKKIFRVWKGNINDFARSSEGQDYYEFLKGKPEGFLRFLSSPESKAFKDFSGKSTTKYFKSFIRSPEGESLRNFVTSPEGESFKDFWMSQFANSLKDFLGFGNIYGGPEFWDVLASNEFFDLLNSESFKNLVDSPEFKNFVSSYAEKNKQVFFWSGWEVYIIGGVVLIMAILRFIFFFKKNNNEKENN